VMVGRNDEHCGDFIGRMEKSIATLPSNIELVIVEWMPPADRPRLVETVQWPDHLRGKIRVITVPGDGPMREYVAKNVGIRRASGELILSTNPDILFPNPKVPRYFDDNCFVRAIRRDLKEDGCFGDRHCNLGHSGLLTEACGDYILMHKSSWFRLCGFPELDTDGHCDSCLVFNADAAGMRQVFLTEDIKHQWHPENPTGKDPFDPALMGKKNEGPWGMEGVELSEVSI
jgi:hypothetical protein